MKLLHTSAQPRSVGTSEPVIVADHVWKRYRPQAHAMSLRQEATKLFQRKANPEQPFWALQDVTFSVYPGESVALVGRNGAGKTTLFRVLSGITSPTQGQVAVRGRFATLIALGAGFNPERTGRQNIYLNAAIQGITPRQVARFIDDIIAFSELGEFIDVPIKRYSSGMVTRLGFSIAVHIFPDLIFIDEVLAVGDAAFQEKCIQRILGMKAEGRTLMFVSHSAAAVRMLCDRAIWLQHGQVQVDGPTDEVLRRYEDALNADPG
jgi:ABC-type polysaccharide/polyol phosphate transport system ATPase subunit